MSEKALWELEALREELQGRIEEYLDYWQVNRNKAADMNLPLELRAGARARGYAYEAAANDIKLAMHRLAGLEESIREEMSIAGDGEEPSITIDNDYAKAVMLASAAPTYTEDQVREAFCFALVHDQAGSFDEWAVADVRDFVESAIINLRGEEQ